MDSATARLPDGTAVYMKQGLLSWFGECSYVFSGSDMTVFMVVTYIMAHTYIGHRVVGLNYGSPNVGDVLRYQTTGTGLEPLPEPLVCQQPVKLEQVWINIYDLNRDWLTANNVRGPSSERRAERLKGGSSTSQYLEGPVAQNHRPLYPKVARS